MGLRALWRNLLIAFQRAPRDSRARAYLVRLALAVLALSALLFFLFVLPAMLSQGLFFQLTFNVGIFALAILARWLMHRKRKRDGELLNISLTTGLSPFANPAEPPPTEGFQRELAQRAHLLLALVLRAAAEIWRPENNAGSGEEGHMRRIQNTQLREKHLWDELDPSEAERMSAPEGTWTEIQMNDFAAWIEQLRILRWVIGLDSRLAPIAHFILPGKEIVRELPPVEEIVAGSRWREPSDLRAEHELVFGYTARAMAELASRNLFVTDEGFAAQLGEFREATRGDSTDFLVGSSTIADLTETELITFTRIADARERYLSYLLENWNAAELPPFDDWEKSTRPEHTEELPPSNDEAEPHCHE